MSRTYYNVCCFSDYSKYSTPYFKRQANKKVRRSEVSNYSNFKKVYNSYNICDFKSICYTEEDLDRYDIKRNKRKLKSETQLRNTDSIRFAKSEEF